MKKLIIIFVAAILTVSLMVIFADTSNAEMKTYYNNKIGYNNKTIYNNKVAYESFFVSDEVMPEAYPEPQAKKIKIQKSTGQGTVQVVVPVNSPDEEVKQQTIKKD